MKKISTRVLKLRLNKFEGAVRNHEMMGSMHPEDHEEIEQAFIRHKKRLIEYFVELMQWNEEFNEILDKNTYERGVRDGLSRAQNDSYKQNMGH